jgi:uracil-DNA glycosylase family 4
MEKYGLGHVLQSISRIHGQVFEAEASYGKIKVVPMYHPATILYNPNLKEDLKKDFEILAKNGA